MSCSILSPADWKSAQLALPALGPAEESPGGSRATIVGLVRSHILAESDTKREPA